MGYKFYNANPLKMRTEDCSVRTISKILNISWDEAYDMLAEMAKGMAVMPSDKNVTSAVLRMNGFYRENLPNFLQDGYTVRDFAQDNPHGIYVLCTDNHVVPLIKGTYYDTFDSGDEDVQWFWTK